MKIYTQKIVIDLKVRYSFQERNSNMALEYFLSYLMCAFRNAYEANLENGEIETITETNKDLYLSFINAYLESRKKNKK